MFFLQIPCNVNRDTLANRLDAQVSGMTLLPSACSWSSLPCETHCFEVAVHRGLQRTQSTGHLRQRGFIAFSQLLHAVGEPLAYPIHLAVDGGVERSEPFVIYDKCFDFRLGKLGVRAYAIASSLNLASFRRFLRSTSSPSSFSHSSKHHSFVFGLLVASDSFQLGGHCNLIHLVEFFNNFFFISVFLFQFGDFSSDAFQLPAS